MDSVLNDIPVVTRYYLVSAFALTLAGNFGLVNPSLLILSFDLVWRKFQVSMVVCVWSLTTPNVVVRYGGW